MPDAPQSRDRAGATAAGTRRRRAIASPILEEAYTMLGRPTWATVVVAERVHADRVWRDIGKA